MGYRDLVPDRQGGFVIASHIRIEEGGPVPDYVHYHRLHFQMIYCLRGWVRVVYEDQGEPFVMHAGDCVLQPPTIRHRVLEASEGLEVVEVSCPSEHETLADHDLTLPTGKLQPDRKFEGQRFVRHVASQARWGPSRWTGFESKDLGIEAGTGGVGKAILLRRTGPEATDAEVERHGCDFRFGFLIKGEASIAYGEGLTERAALRAGASFAIPAGMPHQLRACSPDLEMLEVAIAKRESDEQ